VQNKDGGRHCEEASLRAQLLELLISLSSLAFSVSFASCGIVKIMILLILISSIIYVFIIVLLK